MANKDYIYQMIGTEKVLPSGRTLLQPTWLSFYPDAKIGVLGHNGAGKSTLMKIMAGLDDVYAFSAVDGATVWSRALGSSLSDVTVVGGVVYVGNRSDPILFALDAAGGRTLAELPMPEPVVGGVAVVGNRLFAPYGHGDTAGGARGFVLP